MSLVRTLSHTCLSGIFIIGGFSAFSQPEGRAARVERANIPQPKQAVILNGATMVVAGTALATGLAPKLASLVLIGTLVPTTFVGHPFWQEADPQTRAMQQTQFLKNLSLIGGLIAVLLEK